MSEIASLEIFAVATRLGFDRYHHTDTDTDMKSVDHTDTDMESADHTDTDTEKSKSFLTDTDTDTDTRCFI